MINLKYLPTSPKTAAVLAALIVLGAGAAFAWWQTGSRPAPDDVSSRAHGGLPEDKRTTIDGPDNAEGEDSPDETTASILLNNFGQHEDGVVYANATPSGATEGSCEFRFERSGFSLVKATAIERTPTGYYACGVRLSRDEFDPKGTWQARVRLTGGAASPASGLKEAEIE